jgi:Arc/MetJ family transcription regulator
MHMRTTLELDPTLLEEAQKACGAPTKTATVEAGLRALIDAAARRRLAALAGRLPHVEAPRRRRPERQSP